MRALREPAIGAVALLAVALLGGCVDGALGDRGASGDATTGPDGDPASGDGTAEPDSDAASNSNDGDGNTGSGDCSQGDRECGGTCVDIASSAEHCGSCGNSCPKQANCKSGTCVCSGDETACGDRCVDTSTNSDHCGGCGNACDASETCSSGSCTTDKKVANAVKETNRIRSDSTDCGGSYGTLPSAPPLKESAELHKAAQSHADDMAKNEFFSHTGSDGSSFQERIQDAGFSGRAVAENIAADKNTAASALREWQQSPDDCNNLMSTNANRIGVGVAKSQQYGWVWVEVFGAK